jgi:hypothetical protein
MDMAAPAFVTERALAAVAKYTASLNGMNRLAQPREVQ